jgi:hypothetical protein
MSLKTSLQTCLLGAGMAIAVLPTPGFVARAAAPDPERYPAVSTPAPGDHQHDFDFEFGAWKAHLTRRLRPLTGSQEWVEYAGTSTVRPVWGGKANQGELEVEGPKGHIEGTTLRFYNPETRAWSISWANSNDGQIGAPMVGRFDTPTHGEFYDQEMLNGQAIQVRFVFAIADRDHFRLEQAFSNDGGKSWEVNWISDFARA